MYTEAGIRPRPDLDGLLHNFSVGGHVAHRVLPMLPVMNKAGQFFIRDTGAMQRVVKTKRAPGTQSVRGSTPITSSTFVCEERSFEEPVDVTVKNMFGSNFDAEYEAGITSAQTVALDYEADVAAACFNTSTFTGATSFLTCTPWSEPAAATPVQDVNTGRSAAENKGVMLNAMVLSRVAARNLWNTAQVRDRLQLTYGTNGIVPIEPTEAALAAVFALDEVVIAGVKQNTAQPGATDAYSSVWSDSYALLFAKNTERVLRSPQLGRTFVWANAFADASTDGMATVGEAPASIFDMGSMYSYAAPNHKSVVVGCQMYTDEVLTNTNAGFLLQVA
jgi:hypothetical protein